MITVQIKEWHASLFRETCIRHAQENVYPNSLAQKLMTIQSLRDYIVRCVKGIDGQAWAFLFVFCIGGKNDLLQFESQNYHVESDAKHLILLEDLTGKHLQLILFCAMFSTVWAERSQPSHLNQKLFESRNQITYFNIHTEAELKV